MIEPFSNVNDNYTFEDNIFKSSLYNKYSDSESNVTFGTSASASTSIYPFEKKNSEGYAKSMFRNADAVVQMLRSSPSAIGSVSKNIVNNNIEYNHSNQPGYRYLVMDYL